MPHTSLDWLDAAELLDPVSRAIGRPVDAIVAWTGSMLKGGSGDTLGVWEIAGMALAAGMPRQWALVLKGWAAPAPGADPTDWDWPRREGEIYRSPLLDRLPEGLAAPRFLGRIERPDGSEWLWLESVLDRDQEPWPLEPFVDAARLLGRFNGRWLAGGELPDVPWMPRDWLVQFTERIAPEIDMLDRAERHSLVARAFPRDVRRGYWRIWNQRARLYDARDALPRTVCHLDAFCRNIVLREGDPAGEMVLIDWSYAGIGAIGEEIAPLIAASLYFGDVPASEAARLEASVLDAYIDGLCASGWRGDAGLVWRGYLIALVLRYGVGCAPQMVRVLCGEGHFPEPRTGEPPSLDEIASMFGTLDAWLVERSEALFDLLSARPHPTSEP